MRKFLALVSARNKEFYRDRSTMMWTLLFPFIVLMGFAYGISGRHDPLLRVTLVPGAPSLAALERLRDTPGIQMLTAESEPEAMKKLERYESDLVILPAGANGAQRIDYSLNPDSDKGKLAERLLLGEAAREPAPRPETAVRPASGRKIRYADWVLPGLLAMNIMFGSMFGVGYVIVRYRKNGVLKRLRATPLSAFQFLAAQVFSRMLLMITTSFLVIGGAMLLIGFKPQGPPESMIDLAAFLAVSSTAMISLGLIVAARISSEELAEGILNLLTWPMIFLSGIWFSLEGASPWVLKGAKLMPLTHVVDGLRAILIDGARIPQLGFQITVLAALSVLFITVGSAIFKWR